MGDDDDAELIIELDQGESCAGLRERLRLGREDGDLDLDLLEEERDLVERDEVVEKDLCLFLFGILLLSDLSSTLLPLSLLLLLLLLRLLLLLLLRLEELLDLFLLALDFLLEPESESESESDE